MAILKGPKNSRPDTARIGDLFWDWDDNKTYKLTANGWASLSDAPAPAPTQVEEPALESAPAPTQVEEPALESAPAPKKTRTKKVVPAEKTE